MAFCMRFALSNNGDYSACNNAVNAASMQAGITGTYNATSKYFEGELYKDVNKSIIYTVAGLTAGVNAYNQKEIKLTTQLNPIFNTVSLDLTLTGPETINVSRSWHW